MWHEARRQERKIRGMLVDYRKRAERRRDFYEKIKADPTQFLQIHGRQCKIHLDQAIAAAADSAVMMSWQGHSDNLIDRFDVRAHLDIIPPVKKEDPPELTQEDRLLNYERYRIIAQNAYLGISEEKFLRQLYLEEQFGYTDTKGKKESKGTGVAIGFNYEDGTAISGPTMQDSPEDHSDDDNSDSDLDVDLAINVSKIDSAQAHEMNKHGQHFGMSGNDFYSFLTNDLEEAESYKLAKEEEHEKALFSGRKSRRERRAHREKRLANRKISPPSYAAKESPTNPSLRDDSKSPSRSPSPDAGKITYITSFGDDEEPPPKPTYAEKVKYGKSNRKSVSSERFIFMDKKNKCKYKTSSEQSYDKKGNQSATREINSSHNQRSDSTSRSIKHSSRSRSFRKRNLSQSRSNSMSRSRRSRSYSRDSSRSRSSRKRKHISNSRSKSKDNIRTRSRSRHRSLSRSSSRSKSRRRSKSRSSSRSRRTRSGSRRSESYRHRTVSSSSLSSSSSSCKSSARAPSPTSSSSRSKSKSKTPIPPLPPKIVPKYYGRKRSDQSSSKSSSSGGEEIQDPRTKSVYPGTSDSKFGPGNNSGIVSKKSTTLTIIERLKRRRQAAINRQFIKDKIAEVQKLEREKQEQQTREDELREMAIKLRRRQREKRHAYDRSSSSDSDKSSVSYSRHSRSPHSRDRDSVRNDRDKRTRDWRSRSRSRERSRRTRSRDRRSRSRSTSRRRERDRDWDSRRDKDSNYKDFKKLVDY